MLCIAITKTLKGSDSYDKIIVSEFSTKAFLAVGKNTFCPPANEVGGG